MVHQPSHHHHDHNYDGAKLIALGAKVIVPEVAVDYWSLIPGADLIVFRYGQILLFFTSQNEVAH